MSLVNFDIPYITDTLPGTGGKIKTIPEHFQVDEIPVYKPSGEGEHLFINITKKGITTKEVQKALARVFKTKVRDVEFAGIKDKYAVTSQNFSVWLLEKQDKNLAYNLEEELPVKINSMDFHQRKIKKGHLMGNAFQIKITDIEMPIDEAYEKASNIIAMIHEKGLPNFYGEQRFGIEGDNAERGYDVLKGKEKIHNKWLRRFLLSSFQSHLFNYYLYLRINRDLFNQILPGDVAKKQDTGGIFIVEDVKQEQNRLDNKEICFTGPMFGKKMTLAGDQAGKFEQEILDDNNVTYDELKAAKLTGTRRAGILLPKIKPEKENDGLLLSFTLPKGAFATVLLREIMKNEVQTN
jgi:tRNA pseudouridine13 synthase